MNASAAGPLSGLRVIELGGIGAVPYCAMLLSDLGADVVRITRDGDPSYIPVINRGRTAVIADLKSAEDSEAVRTLIGSADAVLEGFRPGVAERLGFGPDRLLEDFPRLVIGRITGFGRTGPYADRAGHDLNYIALAGVLHGIGHSDSPPTPPLNLVADFGGGGMLLAFGVTAALLHAKFTGTGQVVDTSMLHGATSLMSMIDGLTAQRKWSEDRGSNLFDGGTPYYDTYECSDGRYVAVAALEPQFYAELLRVLDIQGHRAVQNQRDQTSWPAQRQLFVELFAQHPRTEWERRFADVDACVTPVLTRAEASRHVQNRAIRSFIMVDGVVQPAPVPAFSATPAATSTSAGSGRPTALVIREYVQSLNGLAID